MRYPDTVLSERMVEIGRILANSARRWNAITFSFCNPHELQAPKISEMSPAYESMKVIIKFKDI